MYAIRSYYESSLIKKVLYTALKKRYGGYSDESGKFSNLGGDLKMISDVEFVDQNPIGKSSRSNPVTYVITSYSIHYTKLYEYEEFQGIPLLKNR